MLKPLIMFIVSCSLDVSLDNHAFLLSKIFASKDAHIIHLQISQLISCKKRFLLITIKLITQSILFSVLPKKDLLEFKISKNEKNDYLEDKPLLL